MPAPVRLEGFALHAGVATAVTFMSNDGPVALGRGSHRARLASLRVTRTDLGVAVTDDSGFEVDLVEHVLAAFAGLGIRRGVAAIVEGPELPILDGGARTFAEALSSLDIPEEPPELVVARAGRLDFETSSYDFERGDTAALRVETEFAHPAIGKQEASWDGRAQSFRDEIAPARTFGFASQRSELLARGRAGLAARLFDRDGEGRGGGVGDDAVEAALREAVVIFDESTGRRSGDDEVARHKLLDLIGDFALYGGPPLGRVVARRPGHTATHCVVRRALDCGILSRR